MANFQVFDVAIEFITAVKPAVTAIAMHDRNLADQLKRAASSVPLNINEGARRVGQGSSCIGCCPSLGLCEW